jgi:hypothetical protein
MLTTYLADIEQMLDEHRWEAALREALDLPHIGAALEDSQLCSSGERFKSWCAEWICPLHAEQDTRGLDHERVYHMLRERADRDEIPAAGVVPALALRRLRLRRLARTPPGRFSPKRIGADDPEGSDALEICTTLVEAARRWYAHRACHDPIVQANLARLAVLR